MNAWVFRHLDELQRIYAAEAGSGPPQGAACVQVLDPIVKEAPRPKAVERSSTSMGPGPGEAAPGSVIRCETLDGSDVILTPAKRQHRPRR